MEGKFYTFVLIFIFLFSTTLFVLEKGNIHAEIVGFDLPSNVTIQKSLAISFSSGLGEGIIFDEVNLLPAENVNAYYNYRGINNGTNYYVLVSPDGNTDVDLCIKANGNLLSESADVIGLGNETYSSSQISNLTHPELNEIQLTLTYVKVGETISPGNASYMRFWLDVPAAQAAGTYSNKIYFKGNSVGLGC